MKTSLLVLLPLALLACLLLGFLLRTMDPTLLIIAPLALFLLLFLVMALRWAYQRQLTLEENWRVFASTHGLLLDMAPPGDLPGFSPADVISRQVTGVYQDTPVKFQLLVQGTMTNNAAQFLRGEAQLRAPLPEGVVVTRRGFFDDKGVPTGDARFDASLRLSGLDPQRQADFLTPELRRVLVALSRNVHELTVQGDTLTWRRRGAVHDPERLKIMLRQTALAASTVNHALHGLHGLHGAPPAPTGARLPDFSSLPEPPQEEHLEVHAAATAKVRR